MIATRGPKTAVGLDGVREEGSSSDPVRPTNERMDARKKVLTCRVKGEGEEGWVKVKRTRYQDIDTAGIASNTQKFHHMSITIRDRKVFPTSWIRCSFEKNVEVPWWEGDGGTGELDEGVGCGE